MGTDPTTEAIRLLQDQVLDLRARVEQLTQALSDGSAGPSAGAALGGGQNERLAAMDAANRVVLELLCAYDPRFKEFASEGLAQILEDRLGGVFAGDDLRALASNMTDDVADILRSYKELTDRPVSSKPEGRDDWIGRGAWVNAAQGLSGVMLGDMDVEEDPDKAG